MRFGQGGLLAGLGLVGAVAGFLSGGAILGAESRLTVALVGALVGLGLARALWITRPASSTPPAGPAERAATMDTARGDRMTTRRGQRRRARAASRRGQAAEEGEDHARPG